MARMIKDNEEFKLSKRSGKAVSLRDLIDEAGTDAVRYFFASRAADTQMDFDLDMATKRSNENPVFYGSPDGRDGTGFPGTGFHRVGLTAGEGGIDFGFGLGDRAAYGMFV